MAPFTIQLPRVGVIKVETGRGDCKHPLETRDLSREQGPFPLIYTYTQRSTIDARFKDGITTNKSQESQVSRIQYVLKTAYLQSRGSLLVLRLRPNCNVLGL